ncbi:hypothetical protein S245_040125, partial [Arachis hypogaea]
NELEAAKSEIQSWHSSIQNEPCVPAGATPEPKMLLDYLQALKSSEESLREQLEKAKKKEAAFIVTFAKREQEIAELKVRRLLLDPAIHEEFTRLKVKKMGLNKDEMHMLMKFRDAHASRLSLIQINPRQYHLMRLVAFAVLPPSGCCSVAKELEGSTPCHQFEGVYDFDSDDELQWLIEIEKVNASDVIILEGILVFHDQDVRDLMNMKIFVDTDADVRLARRIRRDT